MEAAAMASESVEEWPIHAVFTLYSRCINLCILVGCSGLCSGQEWHGALWYGNYGEHYGDHKNETVG